MKQASPIRVVAITASAATLAVLRQALHAPEFLLLSVDTSSKIRDSQPEVVLWELQDNTTGLTEACIVAKPIPVLAILSEHRADLAFAASKAGAEGLVTLPADAEHLRAQVRNYRLPEAMSVPTTPLGSIPTLFGNNPRIAEIRDTISKVASTSATVLIRGESGVGKDVVSRMLYEQSARTGRPFVKVNCAAIPDDLLESELFGYEAGAFTGAVRSKPGRFELAHTGTLFLDEIGEMQPALQAKLLHVLQDGAFARLGAKNDVTVDVRVLCATNKQLEQRVADGLFREDLFYRINVVTITIPPLRERQDEIDPLVSNFLRKYAEMYGRAAAVFSEEAMKAFKNYTWPGNIRELENLCKRFVIVGGETQILREITGRSQSPLSSPALVAPMQTQKKPLNLLDVGKQAAWRAEKALIVETLEAVRWNRKEAAKRLGISYRSLRNKVDLIDNERK